MALYTIFFIYPQNMEKEPDYNDRENLMIFFENI